MKKLLLLILPTLLLACSKGGGTPDDGDTSKLPAVKISFVETRSVDCDGETFEFAVTSNVSYKLEVHPDHKNAVQIEDGTKPNSHTIKVTGNGAFARTLKVDVVAQERSSIRKTFTMTQDGSPLMWGLSDDIPYTIQQSRSNNRSYDWYVDQGSTGKYSNINCGPASTRMAAKWADANFSPTTETLRTNSGSTDWWYTNGIFDVLESYKIPRYYISMTDFEKDLKPQLDLGHIAILCLDIYYVRSAAAGNPEEWRRDKYYTTSKPEAGHFIVVKGYKKVDDNYLLEVYDPWSMGAKYADATFKGIDRYYRAEDIDYATSVWWPNAIIVSRRPASRGWTPPADALDPSTVPAQRGR